MTTSADENLLTEETANHMLNTVFADMLTPEKDENLNQAFIRQFGEEHAPLVMRGMFMAMTLAYGYGAAASLPMSDRGEILTTALRQIHVPEMFGDCVEDGDHYPCKTARALNLVTGNDPHASA